MSVPGLRLGAGVIKAGEGTLEAWPTIQQIPLLAVLAIVAVIVFIVMLLRMAWRRKMSPQRSGHPELQRIAEAAPWVIHSFRLGPDGTVSFPYASPAVQDIYGYGPEQLVGDAGPVLAHIHPDDVLLRQAALEASARDLQALHVEYRYLHPGRGEIWVEEKSVPARRPEGGVVWYGILAEVTERKRTEQALRESELLFSTVFRDSPLAITITRPSDGLVIEVNDAFLGLFGLAHQNVIGRSSTELGIWVDTAEKYRLLDKLQAEGELCNVEAKFRHSSGRLLDLLFSTAMIELAVGRCLLSVFADITSLREAERALAASRERYRSLFAHMLEGCVLGRIRHDGAVQADFVVVDANPAFAELFGQQDAAGKSVSDIFPGIREANSALLEALVQVTASGRSKRLETYFTPLAKWFSIAVFSAEPGHFVAVFDDITERKEAQIALEAHRNQLEAAVAARTTQLVEVNKELQAFTYAVSHDLKAPLRGIKGFAAMLEQDYLDRLEGEGSRYVDQIRQSAARMSALIDGLLSYARLETQTQASADVDVPEAVNAILAERQDETRQWGTELKLDMAPATVRVDPQGLAQVLRNLVENALKYSAKATPPMVEIGGQCRPDCYRLWVRDNGVGFDMAYHDQVFELFRRLHGSQDFQGTGVGLGLVKKAVERMGGRVWAESAPGKGASFYVELPLAVRSAEARPASSPDS